MKQSSGKYVSCKWITSGLEFRHDSVRTCCIAYFQGRDAHKSIILKDYHGEEIDWNDFFIQKNLRKDLQKNNTPLLSCENCIYLEESAWSDENYIDTILFNHFIKCNSNCIYCGTTNDKTHYKESQAYNIYPVLKDMSDKKILRGTPNSLIDFGGGEVSILDEFADIFDLLVANGFENFTINSSGIKYSDVIEKGLKMGVIRLVISPDSGTKETYERIKRVPCFDKVYDNIKRYCFVLNPENTHLVQVKYIIIPGYNDSVEEIDSWLDKSKKVGVKNVILDLEFVYSIRYKEKMSHHIFLLIDYAKYRAKKLNLDLELYASIKFLEAYKKNTTYRVPTFFLKFKFLLTHIVNYFKNKSLKMNINYDNHFNY